MIHLARCDGFSLFIAFSPAFLPVFFLPVSLQRVRRFCGNWYHSGYVYSVVVVIFFRFAGLFPLSCFPGFFCPFVFPLLGERLSSPSRHVHFISLSRVSGLRVVIRSH